MNFTGQFQFFLQKHTTMIDRDGAMKIMYAKKSSYSIFVYQY